MKKIISLCFMLLLTGAIVEAKTNDCLFECTAPYGLSAAPLRVISNATGSNILAEKIAQSIIKKEIRKNINGSYKVSLKSYSVADLKKGKFKSLEVQGKNLIMDGVSVSYFDAKTLCKFNYIEPDKTTNSATFKEDFWMGYNITLNESDLNSTMKTSSYTKIIDDLNTLAKDLSFFKVDSTRVKIRNNKLYYVVRISIPFVKNPQDIVMETDLKVRNGDISFVNARIVNEKFSLDIGKLSPILNYLNPLEFSLQILESKNTTVKVQNISIVDNKINISGTIFVPKDVVTEHKGF